MADVTKITSGSLIAADQVEGTNVYNLQGEKLGAVDHQGLVGLLRPVPFQQGELRMMQGAALAVAPHLAELEDAPLAGGQEALAGELRRGAQEQEGVAAARRLEPRAEGVEVRLVARRDLQGGGLDLDEGALLEPPAHGGADAGARRQERAVGGVGVGPPPEG